MREDDRKRLVDRYEQEIETAMNRRSKNLSV